MFPQSHRLKKLLMKRKEELVRVASEGEKQYPDRDLGSVVPIDIKCV